MLVIRLTKIGKKNAPSYRVVLIEKTAAPQSGKFLEALGNYNPRLIDKKTGEKDLSLNEERIKYWLSQGAKASDTVHNLLVKRGIIKGPKIKKKIKAKRAKEEKTKEPKKEVKKEKAPEKSEEKPEQAKEEKKAPIFSPTESEEKNRESSTSEPNQNDLEEVGIDNSKNQE